MAFFDDGEGEEPWGEPCDACGHCNRPGECVISRICPNCSSPVGQLCRDLSAGNRLVKFHDERWALVP